MTYMIPRARLFTTGRDTSFLREESELKYKPSQNLAQNFNINAFHHVIEQKRQSRKKIIQNSTDEISLAGIRFMRSDDQRPTALRVLWILVLIASMIASIVLSSISIVRYYKNEIRTTIKVDYAHEVNFPAITFCNENIALRSVIGASPVTIKGMAGYVSSDNKTYSNYVKKVLDSCYDPSLKNQYTEQMEQGYQFWNLTGFTKACSLIAPDSYTTVKSCSWKQEPFNCSHYFLNHMTDYGWCFTFNPSIQLISMYTLGYSYMSDGYGILEDLQPLSLTSTGPNNGFKVLLDIEQEEYCMTHTSDSAGMKMVVHDPDTQPLFFLEKGISIAPGFHYDVAVKFEKQLKFTENLGRCTSTLNSIMYPKLRVYNREACFLECFSQYVLKQCDCVPPYAPPSANKIMAKIRGSYVKICWDLDIRCMKTIERQFLNEGVDVRCNECKNECNVTRTSTSISSTYFPAKHLTQSYATYIPKEKRTKRNVETYIRQSYISINFYIESKQIIEVLEIKDFTGDQLLSAIGGTVGLFMGVSILSLLELLQVFMFCCFPQLQGASAKQKMQPIHS